MSRSWILKIALTVAVVGAFFAAPHRHSCPAPAHAEESAR